MREETLQIIEKAKSGKYINCIFGAGYVGRGIGYQLLSEYGIEIVIYSDNNDDLWGKEIKDNVICMPPQYLEKNSSKIICFVMMRCDYIRTICDQLRKLGIEHIVTYDDILEDERIIYNYFDFMKKKQIVVYTCVVGDYDNVREPLYISDKCDYCVISEEKKGNDSTYKWKSVYDVVPQKWWNDNTRMNRYCKINAHEIFPEYKYSIYVDGNIIITEEMAHFFERLPKTYLAVSGESYWDSVYIEAFRCIESKRDKKEVIMKQVQDYWNQGMPDHYGAFLCNVLLREHNNPICKKLMQDWWEQLTKYSRRDQISLPYVLWKNGFTASDIMTLAPKPGFISDYWIFEHEHNCHRISNE